MSSSTMIRTLFARTSRSSISVLHRPVRYNSAIIPRAYATTTKGDQPNASQNLGTPSPKPSDSPQEGSVKSARSAERAPQESGSSVANPISKENQSAGELGSDEEGTDPTKRDPNKPAEQKRKEVLKEGEKPLDPGQSQHGGSAQFSQKMQQ